MTMGLVHVPSTKVNNPAFFFLLFEDRGGKQKDISKVFTILSTD